MEIRPIFSALLRSKTAPLLVALQVAISLAILANAVFVVSQRLAVAERPSGIADEANVFTVFSRSVKKLTHEESLATQNTQRAALKAIPGVAAVAWTTQMPMTRSGSSGSITLDIRQTEPSANPSRYVVQEDFIPTLGLKLVEGRNFTAEDIQERDPNADNSKAPATQVIITKALADLLYPGVNAVGRSFNMGLGPNGSPVQVIGVVERLQHHASPNTEAAEHSILIPARLSNSFSRWAIRTEPGQRDRLIAEAETALRKASFSATEVRSRTTEEDRLNRYRNERALAWMLVAVSVLLLVVTASGIVGMTTLRVAQRKKQIGVRRALGARRVDILRHFMTENFMVTSGGIAVGLALAVGLNQLLVAQLSMKKLPLEYLAGGAIIFWVLGVITVYGPAWRAANIPPSIATRGA